MRFNTPRTELLPLFLAAAALTSACLNLDDVASLTKTADSAQQTLPAVVKDWPASCDRFNTLVHDIPARERPPSMQPLDCAPYKAVADHLLKDETILIAYFDALGKLASNNLFTFDKAVDTNVTSIGAIPGLAKKVSDTSAASDKLAKALADIATQGYRSHEVNALILRADDAVTDLTGDLKDVITKDYVIQLGNESNAVKTFYESPIEAASAPERLALVLVQRQYSADKSAVASRQTAADNYGKLMDNLGSLHRTLKDEITRKASLKEIASSLGPYVSGVKSAIDAIKQEIK